MGQRHSLRFRIVAVAAMTLALSACNLADDGYTYVNNQRDRAFFKLPDSWGHTRLKVESTLDRPTPIQGGVPWKVFFDTTAKPKASALDDPLPKKPVGQAEVITLSRDGQDMMNEVLLRSMLLDGYGDGSLDPVDEWQKGNEAVEIVGYSRFANKGGVWGSKLIINVRLSTPDGGGQWLTLAQKAYVDRSNSKVVRLTLKCASSCYKARRNQMNQVLDSLQLSP